MADFANVVVPNRISALLDQIRRANRPSKVTQDWLESVGLKTKNDRGFIGLLKALGYIDASAVPTDKWPELKASEAERRASIGRQMQQAFPAIFDHWPTDTIKELTREEIKDFIRPRISAGEPTVDNAASTFLALRSMASFDGPSKATHRAPEATEQPVTPTAPPEPQRTQQPSGVNVTINLSLEIPPTNDADVYEKLFASMAKHLGDLLNREP